VLLAPDGSVDATYRKIHLFGFSEGEATQLTAGTDLVVHDGRLGTLGLATCYDLRFPELFRGLVDRSVVAVSLVASWPERRIAHWRLLAQARAVEDQVYVLACNAVGTHAGVTMGGHSMVVDPWGEVLAEAGTDEQVLTVDVDLSSVAGIRERFPVLGDRRIGVAEGAGSF
jgi:predicted amidohydrolase